MQNHDLKRKAAQKLGPDGHSRMRTDGDCSGSGALPKALRARRPTEDAVVPKRPSPPSTAGVGKRWKFRRNVVIFIAYRNGVSQRGLADVFDLPRSTIAAVIKDFKRSYPD